MTETPPRFAVVGESLVDIVVPTSGPTRAAPGGSPLNVAVGLARLGVETVLLTEMGEDDLGEQIRRHIAASGARLAAGSVVPGRRTSTATARLDRTGAATYDFDLRWELGPRTLPAGVTGLHVGSLGTALRPGRAHVVDLAAGAADQGLLVTFDPNVRPAVTPDAEGAWADVQEVAQYARLVKMSDEDLAFLRPAATADELAEELLGGVTELFVVTHGGAGAVAFSRVGRVEVRSRPAEVTDTVGAGDSFMAALIAVVLEQGTCDLDEHRLRGCVEAAHQAAAVTVSRRGADPPTRAELPPGWPGIG